MTETIYTRLKDGSWGIRVPGSTATGRSVTVRKKDGSSKTETVSRVLWTGKDSKTLQWGRDLTITEINEADGGEHALRLSAY